ARLFVWFHHFPRAFGASRRLCAMTQGEYLFYLREIHGHWCASNVSPDKLEELAGANLIELRPGPPPSVRLTVLGKQCKFDGRSDYKSRLPVSRRQKAKPRTQRPRATSRISRPRPLV